MGKPIRACELLSTLEETKYLERTSINSMRNIIKTKAAIKKAFLNQLNNVGFSMVEILSPCPTYWGLTPVKAMERIEKEVVKTYPLGVIKG